MTPVLIVVAGILAACVIAVPPIQRYRGGKPLRGSDKFRLAGSGAVIACACLLAYYSAAPAVAHVPPRDPMPFRRPFVGGRSVSVPMPPPPINNVVMGGGYVPYKYQELAVPVPAALRATGGGELPVPAPAPVVPAPVPAPVVSVPAPVVPVPAPVVPVTTGGAAVTVSGDSVILEGFQF